MYTVTSFHWPDGFPTRPVQFSDQLTERRFPNLFVENIAVKGVGRSGSIGVAFRGGIRNGTAPSGFDDFFVGLTHTLGATRYDWQNQVLIISFELGPWVSEEHDDQILMEKYLALLRYCGIQSQSNPDLVPHIIREAFVGRAPTDPAALHWGHYLFVSVLADMTKTEAVG